MKKGKIIGLIISHGLALALGFAAGIYALPLLIAPDSPSSEMLMTAAAEANFIGEFQRDLADSDALHWGEGEVFVGPEAISHAGRLAPGPDYKLYLSPTFVETEAAFERLKAEMVRVGDIDTFEGFVVPLSSDIDPTEFTTVIVWCEAFGEFITAARYR